MQYNKIRNKKNKCIFFSVITVVYNDKINLENTIRNVINQNIVDFNCRLTEYIIIDGGSFDGTLDIIKKYENKIEYWNSESDNGLYDAMNKGIEIASGKYIIFMNAGDIFVDSKTLYKIKNLLNVKDYPDFIYGDSIEVSKDGRTKFYKKAKNHRLIWYGLFTHHQAMLYKRQIIKECNLQYDLKYKIAADYDFTAKFLKLSSNILQIKIPVCVFKQGGISMKNILQGRKEQLMIRKKVFKYSFAKRFVIFILQGIISFIRVRFTNIYNILRFKKI